MKETESRRLAALVGQMRAMVDDEQKLIAAGRLEDLVEALGRRQELMREVDFDDIPEGPILDAFREIRASGDKTLTLLCAIRDELGGHLGQGRETRKAVGQYVKSASF